MLELAPDCHLIPLMPRHGINAYLIGDVLVDAGMPFSAKRILKALEGRTVSAHALTHAHPDHMGASKAVCEALGIPCWCGEADAEAAESGDLSKQNANPDHWFCRFQMRKPLPGVPVARRLREGDEVGGFTVLETPGHTMGHLSYWREHDRVLITGDTLFHMHILTTIPGLHEPINLFTMDRKRNHASIRRLAALEPAIAAFGHGPPLRDPGALQAFADRLPESGD